MVAYNQQPQYAADPAAERLQQETLSGKFLAEGNPHLDDVIANANRDTMDAFRQSLGELSGASLRPGALGSSIWSQQRRAMSDDVARRVADASTGVRFANYGQERGFQNQALDRSQQRDQAIWSDILGRRGQDTQRDIAREQANASRAAASASAGAARYNAELAAKAREAETRANLLLGQGRLAEEGRQFDAGMPLQWASLLGGQIGQYGAQEQGDLAQLGSLIGTQLGAEQGAVGLGTELGLGAGGLDLQGAGQQLQAAGMLPGFEAAELQGQGMAGDYLASLYGSDAGLAAARANANASRYSASLQDEFQRDALGYQSARDQWGYSNPQGALNDFMGNTMGFGQLAGGTQTGRGVGAPAPGAVVGGGDKGYDEALAAGLSIAMLFGY